MRLARGETGLLITQVTDRFRFEGYTDRQATERKLLRDVFAPGDVWVNTGDLMRHLGYGHLQFVDRAGDTFRWKSENVATREVEAAVAAEPSVADACVYGVKVADAPGRAGMVAVVPANGHVDTAGLLARLREQLPEYAVPRFVRITDSLAVTGTFKHVKSRLREEGFAPERVTDPVLVWVPRTPGYTAMTPALYDRIVRHEVSL